MIDWKKLGFYETRSGGKQYTRNDLNLYFQEENGFLTIYAIGAVGTYNVDVDISYRELPATEESVMAILKAFNKDAN